MGGCAGGAGPTGGWEGEENILVYSLGPGCTGAGGAAAGGVGAETGGAAGELNILVYSPGPEGGAGGGGAAGLALEKTLVPPPDSTGGGVATACGCCGDFPGAPGAPNIRVKAPGSCCGGGGGGGGLAAGGRLRSSPPGRDSGKGD